MKPTSSSTKSAARAQTSTRYSTGKISPVGPAPQKPTTSSTAHSSPKRASTATCSLTTPMITSPFASNSNSRQQATTASASAHQSPTRKSPTKAWNRKSSTTAIQNIKTFTPTKHTAAYTASRPRAEAIFAPSASGTLKSSPSTAIN